MNNAIYHQVGNNKLSKVTKFVAQRSRVSLWLWSVATNPNPSKLRAQENKALKLCYPILLYYILILLSYILAS